VQELRRGALPRDKYKGEELSIKVVKQDITVHSTEDNNACGERMAVCMYSFTLLSSLYSYNYVLDGAWGRLKSTIRSSITHFFSEVLMHM
jgi:hypothetical protein